MYNKLWLNLVQCGKIAKNKKESLLNDTMVRVRTRIEKEAKKGNCEFEVVMGDGLIPPDIWDEVTEELKKEDFYCDQGFVDIRHWPHVQSIPTYAMTISWDHLMSEKGLLIAELERNVSNIKDLITKQLDDELTCDMALSQISWVEKELINMKDIRGRLTVSELKKLIIRANNELDRIKESIYRYELNSSE